MTFNVRTTLGEKWQAKIARQIVPAYFLVWRVLIEYGAVILSPAELFRDRI
jgi:hypothetical protein